MGVLLVLHVYKTIWTTYISTKTVLDQKQESCVCSTASRSPPFVAFDHSCILDTIEQKTYENTTVQTLGIENDPRKERNLINDFFLHYRVRA